MATPEHLADAHEERSRDHEENRDRRRAELEEKLARLQKLLDEGLTAPVIAQRLGVSARQVRKLKRELAARGSNRSGKPA